MNALFRLVDEPIAQRIGWLLLHSLWQGTLIGGLFELARFALRRSSANARYLAGCFALALLITAPVMTLFVMSAPVAQSGMASSIGASESGAIASGPFRSAASGSPIGHASTPAFQSGATAFLSQLAPWLSPLWLAGVIIFSFKLTLSWWSVGKIRAGENESLDSAWLARLEELRRRLGISRPVRLVKSALVEVPAVIGWLRPMILLPAASLTGLAPAQLEAILAHELAHVRRFDYLVNAFQCVVETLMFYHPVTWWISRCVREERENCCDDLVIEVCGNRIAYARALASLEEFRAELPQMAFAASGGSLLNRVRRLLGMSSDNGPATGRQVAGLALLGIGLALIGLGVFINAQPTLYRAAAVIRVERESVPRVETSNGEIKITLDSNFSAPDVAAIRSEAVLNRVIENLKMTNVMTRSPLASKIAVQPAGASNQFEIRVFDEKPDEAARIANAVAMAYQEFSAARQKDLGRGPLQALIERMQQQEQEVRVAQSNVDYLRNALQIADPDPASTMPTPTISAEALRQLQAQFILLKDKEVAEETKLANLKKLDPPHLREAIQTTLGQPDATLTTLRNELDLAEQRLLLLEKDYAQDNPVYQNAKKQVEDLDRKVDRAVNGILLGLETGLKMTQSRIAEFDRWLASAKSNDLRVAELTRPYYEAKQQLAAKVQFNQILSTKLASEKTDLALPRNPPVQIVESAVAPEAPFRPNRVRGFALICLGALLSLAGFLMLREKRAVSLTQPV